jgi:hypothetical protein
VLADEDKKATQLRIPHLVLRPVGGRQTSNRFVGEKNPLIRHGILRDFSLGLVWGSA